MKRRKVILGGLCFASLATTAACGGGGQSGGNQAGDSKTLTMLTSPDYPPYGFYQTSGGERKIVGFDIDIANYIAKELGYQLRVQESDFNGLIPALQANRADFVMAGMTPTDERKKNVDFSNIYFQAQNTIVALKGSNLVKAENLAGKRVGVQLGSIQEGDLKKIAEKVQGIQVKTLNRVPEIIQEIKAKRIDAAIIEDTVVKGFAQANADLEYNVIPSEGPSGSAIAFPKGSPRVAEFNGVLDKMKANGELDRLAKQWFATTIPASPAASPSPTASPSPSPTN
ncbi:transporter substrate-binding domain-containing protein [Leptolyngbya sp. AN03gr2]|uniref:transporter substrate-binding domain-containing protein n=1 Tax=unclassified Leptolyngbya TaxID=2650499 RepID=UPI003D31EBB3